ncbi:trihelix transcription factor ASIL1-like [Tripterygium wilfordii]|uniref:Trihelix transcription factor ASIL1-like n=1 Tax=Tripterygium wilfordii TaxID=458696 RepID=A0A7J7BYE7_TRIWF|nr:trihelix transcription factor ASIL1-like [Tripterygium wilfordii]KAF5726893.1 trihelix transcription factor ASIL1-like [Tripterygium wilfordii]
MDDTEDDAKYPPNPYVVNRPQGYGSSRAKLPVRNMQYPQAVGNQYVHGEDNEDENEEEKLGVADYPNNGYVDNGGDDSDDDDDYDDDDDDDGDVEDEDEDVKDGDGDGDGDGEDEDEDVDDGDAMPKNYSRRDADKLDDLKRHPKKRKLKSLASSYEFAPRVLAPPITAPAAPRTSFGGRNSLTDWNERETFALLDAWGDRFLQRGRKSLRAEEWQEVAGKVSAVSNIERTDTQCRNRLDTLKKKYKKEKLRLTEMGGDSKWVYFKKMDMLMSSSAQQGGLSCGLDSGDYVFMNPSVSVNHANAMDEMRDSPENSESRDGHEDDSDGLPPKKRRFGKDNDTGSSFRLLADSIHKFSEIYEKIENSKRNQMLELEKMRMDFHKELEMQKMQIMEKAQVEIAKLQLGDAEDNDASPENRSG